jgi:drug/metabolite transporter (DMT)-like permease
MSAILLMCTAAACFVVSNALVKHIGQWLPTGEMLFVRGCAASLMLLAVALALQRSRQLQAIGRTPVLVRATVEGVGSTLFLASLAWLPLANAAAIDLSAPLMLSALAVIFLGERVSARRWMAIGIGFVGVLLVVQPRAHDFNSATLLCILGTGLHAVRDLLTRRIPPEVPSVLVALSSTLALTLISGIWSLSGGWQPVHWFHLGWLVLGAGFLVGGVLCAITSLRAEALSTVAPFRFLSLPLALVLGFFVWGELPGPLAWVGSALIAGSSLCILRGAKPAPSLLQQLEVGKGAVCGLGSTDGAVNAGLRSPR